MTARTDYERVHDRLMQEIPQLIDGRLEYFGACIIAVLKAPGNYCSLPFMNYCYPSHSCRVCITMNAVEAFKCPCKLWR